MDDEHPQTESTAAAPKAHGSALAASVGVVAEVVSGVDAGATRFVGQKLRIGKGRDNGLVLSDRTVSRHHCELSRTNEGIRVVDLGSTNGTRVNGAMIRDVVVMPGTILKVGSVEIALRPNEKRLALPPSDRTSFGNVVGGTLVMRELFGVLEYMAPSEASILLQGETGTGKDLVARAIVAQSRRSTAPLVVIDCGAVSHALLESEAFGHERGAFTGATAVRKGVFESAKGGTVFIDEIGELPLDLQPKLLRVLEAREIRRVGGSRTIPVDVRVVAATRRDLRAEIEAGRFREDLYFRLAVVPLTVPPLRTRLDDIPLLLARILASAAATDLEVTPNVVQSLMAHSWPGNVRELRNVVERGIHLARGMGLTALPLAWLNEPR